jgi:hypothetical protein
MILEIAHKFRFLIFFFCYNVVLVITWYVRHHIIVIIFIGTLLSIVLTEFRGIFEVSFLVRQLRDGCLSWKPHAFRSGKGDVLTLNRTQSYPFSPRTSPKKKDLTSQVSPSHSKIINPRRTQGWGWGEDNSAPVILLILFYTIRFFIYFIFVIWVLKGFHLLLQGLIITLYFRVWKHCSYKYNEIPKLRTVHLLSYYEQICSSGHPDIAQFWWFDLQEVTCLTIYARCMCWNMGMSLQNCYV